MQELEFALDGISITGSIVDIETVSIEPVARGIFTFGYLSENTIRIIQAEGEDDFDALDSAIRDIWNKLPRPIRAYNRDFVGKWIGSVLGSVVEIDEDLMEPWKAMADQQSLKWPRLRELMRPPVFYFRWGIARYDRERDPRKLRYAIRKAGSVNEVISREAIGATPHLWWQDHLEAMKSPDIQSELAVLSEVGYAEQHSPYVYRLSNGNWTTSKLAAIVCHNMMDLQSQASLLLWQWKSMSRWL